MSPPLVSTLPEDGGITCAKWGAISHDSQSLGDGQVVFFCLCLYHGQKRRGNFCCSHVWCYWQTTLSCWGASDHKISYASFWKAMTNYVCCCLLTRTWWWVFSIEPSAVDTNSSPLSERAKQSAVMLLSIFTEVRYCVCVQHMELAPVSSHVNTTELKSHDWSHVKCHMWNRMLLKVPLGRD